MVKYVVVSPGRCGSTMLRSVLLSEFNTTHTHPLPIDPDFESKVLDRKVVLVERRQFTVEWALSHLFCQAVSKTARKNVCCGPCLGVPKEEIQLAIDRTPWPLVGSIVDLKWVVVNFLKTYSTFKQQVSPACTIYCEDLIKDGKRLLLPEFNIDVELPDTRFPRAKPYDQYFTNYSSLCKTWEYVMDHELVTANLAKKQDGYYTLL